MSKASGFRVGKAQARVTALEFKALRPERAPPASINIAGNRWRDSTQNQKVNVLKGQHTQRRRICNLFVDNCHQSSCRPH